MVTRLHQAVWLACVAGGVLLLFGSFPAGCAEDPPASPPKAKPTDDPPKPSTPGRWRRFRTHKFDRGLTEVQRAQLEQLESIGYLQGSTKATLSSGVTVHVKEKVCSGLNFYTSGHDPEAVLMNMNGEVLHTWSYLFWKAWPDYPVRRKNPNTNFWRRAYLYPNGDILAIFDGLGIIKLDKSSRLLWANPCRAHHDLEVMPDGRIYVLTREARLVPHIDKEEPILEDFVTLLDTDGTELHRFSLLRAFEQSNYRGIVPATEALRKDIFHTNTLEVLDHQLAGLPAAFRKGNLLVSVLNFDVVAVVDLQTEQVVWARKGSWRRQHQPTLLNNGHLLLFDNRGKGKHSAVIEFDPWRGKEVWRYQGSSDNPFSSYTCGSSIRLPNGNTLITESDNGRAFEVTREKQIVWEYISPHRAGGNDELIATLFEVIRLVPGFPVDWLENRPRQGD